MNLQRKSIDKSWWKDPSAFGDIVAFIAATLAIGLSIFDLLDLLEFGWFSDNLAKLTLLLVSLVVISSIVERRQSIKQLQSSLLNEITSIKIGPYQGLEKVYSNREELPPYTDTVQSAKKEIYIAGVEFGYIALQQLPTLEKLAQSGCTIRMLLVNPGSSEQKNPLVNVLQETFELPQLGELLVANLHRISHWKMQLPPKIANRIEIRVTNSAPTHIVTFIDKDLPSGKMLLEMLPPKIDARNRWLVLISSLKGGELYSIYVKAYEKLWNESIRWDGKTP